MTNAGARRDGRPDVTTTPRDQEQARPRGRFTLPATSRHDLVAVLALAGLTTVFFGRVLFTEQALYWGDLLLTFYPAHDLWKRSILEGHLPLWNPYVFNGLPLLADAEYSPLYPSMLLNLILPLHRALALDLALHVFLLGAFTYAFLRQKGLPVGPSFLGAVTWAFSGFVAVRLTQPSLLRTLAWVPLLLWAIERIGAPFKDRRAPLYVGLILAAQIFAGHLQTLLISMLLALAYGIWRAVEKGEQARKSLLAVAAAFLLGGLLALALAAVQVLPGAELVQHSDRSGGKGIQFAATFALPLRQVPMLLSPRLFGSPDQGFYWGEWLYWEMVGYFGVVSFLLALVGLVCAARRDRVLWAVLGLCGVAIALGQASPVFHLAYRVIPGVAYFRAPARFLIWYGWAVAVLAAYGAHWLSSPHVRDQRWWRTAAAIAAVGALALYWAAGGPGVMGALSWLARGAMRASGVLPLTRYGDVQNLAQEIGIGEGRRFALLWLGSGLVIAAAALRRLHPRALLVLLVALATGDLLSYGLNFYPTVEARALSAPVPTEQLLDLQEGRYRILPTPTFMFSWLPAMTLRFTPRPGEDLQSIRAALAFNIGAQQQIPSAGGYSPIAVRQMTEFLALAIRQGTQSAGRSPLIDFMAARDVFTRTDVSQSYRKVFAGSYYIFRNERALPRGFLVTRFSVQPNDALVLSEFISDWDPAQLVILDRPPAETYNLRPTAHPGEIIRRSYGLTRLTFDLALQAPAIFVLSDTYYPGWRAYVDGVEQPIYRANHAFRAVFLPVGARHLEFVFRPWTVALGGLISLGTWALLVGGWLAARIRHGTRKGTDNPRGGRTSRADESGMASR